jgi:hypothetical protein
MKQLLFPIVKWTSRISMACVAIAMAFAVIAFLTYDRWHEHNLTIIDTGPIMAGTK